MCSASMAAGGRVSFERPAVLAVAPRHAQEAAHLFGVRAVLLNAPQLRLHQLQRLDDRLEAQLDGWLTSLAQSHAHPSWLGDSTHAGEFFVATVQAIQTRDVALLERLLSAAEASPELSVGLHGALAWLPPSSLQDLVRRLVESGVAFRRGTGLLACAAHGIDLGPMLTSLLDGVPIDVRCAVRAGLGRADLRAACALPDGSLDLNSAWARVLLGERGDVLQSLLDLAVRGLAPDAGQALSLGLKLITTEQAGRWLHQMAYAPHGDRLMVKALGVLGDPQCVPWLVERMADERLARLAGEAFSLITGADLAQMDLERPLAAQGAGPTDDPDDEAVAMDEDEGLPWPDAQKVSDWWQRQAQRFPAGMRFFMGAPPSPEGCLQVLRHGHQRQRIAAAQWRCLLAPGTALFNTAAPARRQQQWLAQMGG